MKLEFDFSQMARKAKELGASIKQVPFALSVALNDVAGEAKQAEDLGLMTSFDRPTPFTRRAIGRTYANKKNLHVEVFVKDIQAKYLKYGVEGGTRRAAGRKIPVPGKRMRLNQYGNMTRGAVGKAAGRANTFVGRPSGRADLPVGIWQRSKSGLKLLVLFTPQADYDERFDFYGIFENTIVEVLPDAIAAGFHRAMSTARPGRR